MIQYTTAVQHILQSLGVDPGIVIANDKLRSLKQFVTSYVSEHDNLEESHPVILQIQEFNTIDEIEQILRHTLEYRDGCLLEMYRKCAISVN